MVEGVTRYVCGFGFDVTRSEVLLIWKQRPEWQRGKLNGIGGHIEDFDVDVRSAMVREFQEETGLDTKPEDWSEFVQVYDDAWRVHFFRNFNTLVWSGASTTDEEVQVVPVSGIRNYPTMPNLQWLIPMALVENAVPPWSSRQGICTP